MWFVFSFVIDTSELQKNGFGKMILKIILFFRRKHRSIIFKIVSGKTFCNGFTFNSSGFLQCCSYVADCCFCRTFGDQCNHIGGQSVFHDRNFHLYLYCGSSDYRILWKSTGNVYGRCAYCLCFRILQYVHEKWDP